MEIEEKGFEEIKLIKPLWEGLNRHHQASSVYFKQKYEYFTFEKRMDALKIKAETGQIKLYILRDTVKDDIAGYCIASIIKSMGAIDSILIGNDFRKKGYGGKLIDQAFQWFEKNSISDISIDVVYDNRKALPFYQRYGFYISTYVLKKRNI